MKYATSYLNNQEKIFIITKADRALLLNKSNRIIKNSKLKIPIKQLDNNLCFKYNSFEITNGEIFENDNDNNHTNKKDFVGSLSSDNGSNFYLHFTDTDSLIKLEDSISTEIKIEAIREEEISENKNHTINTPRAHIKPFLLLSESSSYKKTKKGVQILGKWTKEEDNLLLKGYETHGNNWAEIAKVLKTRSSKQIRSRFLNYLNNNLDKSPFTEEEDNLMISLYPYLKSKWTRYLNYLTRRSARAIESRLCSLLKKQIKTIKKMTKK